MHNYLWNQLQHIKSMFFYSTSKRWVSHFHQNDLFFPLLFLLHTEIELVLSRSNMQLLSTLMSYFIFTLIARIPHPSLWSSDMIINIIQLCFCEVTFITNICQTLMSKSNMLWKIIMIISIIITKNAIILVLANPFSCLHLKWRCRSFLSAAS